ncbi:hypothetical protein RO3G_05344 [Rhizopus delemar RA 99-880]|uniref:Integrase catalytic domain-containing protein n=1 Tax=Rhizopus delemar (strain RA 99-880 / ATCC MYA-4621 / FGSC 9543 / NRRL 43880) TaxID=246409 RepID=I1BWQ9_RHIO9|nr:hypothetical protein RO3G_05344 [Rhizopus delemar RA 99-880]|eukprot:EIE80639.1 hypothetical protein RO3G_05344 [Rhizopus delemar RA 99-880]
MADNDQSTQVSSLNKKGNLNQQEEETSRVSEDIEMAIVEEAASTTSNGFELKEDPSIDAVMGLRVTLTDLRQQIARAVVTGAPQEELTKLQEQAVNIKNCIQFLDDAQAFCITPPTPVGNAVFSPGFSNTAFNTRSAHIIPPDLPVWQWRGNVWRKDADVHDSVEDLLDTFSLIIESNGLSVDSSWSRLVPIKMNRDQRSWFNEVLKGRSLTWSEVRKIIVKTYAAQDVAQELEYMDQLLSLKMLPTESIEAFTDRFQRIRRAAKWDDDIRTASIYKRALPGFLRQEVSRSLLNLGRDQQDSVTKVAAKARMVLSSNLCSESGSSNRQESGLKISSSPLLSKGTEASKYNPNNLETSNNQLGNGKRVSMGSMKNKFRCAIHGIANHPTERCNKYKDLLKQNSSSVITPSAASNRSLSFVSVAKNCYRCLGNVPWSKEHAARCPRDKPYHGPTKAIRSVRLDTANSNGNKPNLTVTPQARPQQASSKVSSGDSNLMDVDDEGYPVSYDFDRNVSGSVILATSDNVSKRFGTTKFPLSVIYGDNDKNLIHTSHSFEVLPLSLDTEVVIGLDLMHKLNILVTNLAIRHPNLAPVIDKEITDDTPEPNKAPFGTLEQQAHFHNAIKPFVDQNALIPKNSFCTVPESVIRLDTVKGKTAYRAPYRTPFKLLPIMRECIDTWLKDEVIERASPNSDWNSPLTLAPKKDLLGSTIFTTLDLRQAFHRFQIYEPDRVKTTFTFEGQQYQFRGCPFGLKHIASRYQRVINISYEEHITHVQNIIQRLTKVNLILNPDKCHFAQSTVYLLGFCVDAKGSRLDPRKVTNALTWPRPSSGKEIQRFLGLVNYFRKYLPNISEVTAPLDKLRFEGKLDKLWTSEQESAFEKIKALLSSAPLLHHPDLEQPFYVATDASNYSIGAVLYQVIKNETRYIGFMARSLSSSEKNYSTTKRELLAVIFALKKFHPFLWGNPFTLYTDHKALTYLHTQPVANAMMINWLDTILDYNFKIIHRPGIQNILPDALSRLFEPEKTLEGDNKTIKTIVTSQIINSNGSILTSRMMMPADLMTPAPEDRQKLLMDTHLEGHRGAQAIVTALHSDGIHWTKLKEDALEIIRSCPDCQKFNIAKHGYNPLTSIYADAPWDHICIDTAGPFPTSVQGNQYILLVVDVFTRYCVLKALPDKSSLTIALALRSILSLFGRPKIIQSDNGTEYVNEIVRLYVESSGIDHRLISAYHPRANGIVERWVGKAKNILHKRLQGRTEDWDLYVDSTQEALNNTHTALHGTRPFSLMFARRPNENKDYNNVLDKTKSPETMKQLETRINEFNDTVLPAIREKIKTSQAASRDKFNQTHRILTDIPTGSQVTLKNVNRVAKSDPLYVGNYTVKRKTQGGSYVLVDATGALLPRDVPPSQIKVISQEVSLSNTDQSESYDVEAVLHHKGSPGNYLYKVRWKGYGEEDDTWEPASHFHDYRPIQKYWLRISEQEPAREVQLVPKKRYNQEKKKCASQCN